MSAANLTCTPATVANMSEVCMGPVPAPDECDVYHRGAGAVNRLVVAFQVAIYANMLVGVVGNLLTLMAIPYAMCKRRLGFQVDSTSSVAVTHLYILHLAFVDFLFCLLSAIIHLIPLFKRGWPYGHVLCALSVFLRYCLNFADCAQLALIALSRSVFLSFPRLSDAAFTGKAAIVPPLTIWALVAFLVVIRFMEKGDLDFVGFNCMTGTCSLIKKSRYISAWISASVLVPFVVLILSNINIWKAVRKSSANFNQSGSSHLQSQLSAREHRMTRMVGTMCVSYALSNIAGITIKILDPRVEHVGLSYASKLVFYAKYSVNFVIYCARNSQYREAYLLFLKDVLCCGQRNAAPAAMALTNISGRNSQQQQQQQQVVYSAGRVIPYSS